MKKPSICIPHPAEFWFVVIFLGCGACAFLILALICALRGDLLNVILCFVAVALFIAGVRFEVRMNGDFYRIDEDAIHIYRDWRESGSLRWDELTSLALRRGQYRGKPGRFLEAGVQVDKGWSMRGRPARFHPHARPSCKKSVFVAMHDFRASRAAMQKC